jgi:hypothetical protein
MNHNRARSTGIATPARSAFSGYKRHPQIDTKPALKRSTEQRQEKKKRDNDPEPTRT